MDGLGAVGILAHSCRGRPRWYSIRLLHHVIFKPFPVGAMLTEGLGIQEMLTLEAALSDLVLYSKGKIPQALWSHGSIFIY